MEAADGATSEEVKIAISGFGTIGRETFKNLWGRPGVNIVGINDPANPGSLADLLKFDSVQGHWKNDTGNRKVEARDGRLIIDGQEVPLQRVQGSGRNSLENCTGCCCGGLW